MVKKYLYPWTVQGLNGPHTSQCIKSKYWEAKEEDGVKDNFLCLARGHTWTIYCGELEQGITELIAFNLSKEGCPNLECHKLMEMVEFITGTELRI